MQTFCFFVTPLILLYVDQSVSYESPLSLSTPWSGRGKKETWDSVLWKRRTPSVPRDHYISRAALVPKNPYLFFYADTLFKTRDKRKERLHRRLNS